MGREPDLVINFYKRHFDSGLSVHTDVCLLKDLMQCPWCDAAPAVLLCLSRHGVCLPSTRLLRAACSHQ